MAILKISEIILRDTGPDSNSIDITTDANHNIYVTIEGNNLVIREYNNVETFVTLTQEGWLISPELTQEKKGMESSLVGKMRLKVRRIVGAIANIFNTRFSSCHRCNRPWSICDSHLTLFNDYEGCSPLCVDCWAELSPVQRWPFYKELITSWRISSYSNTHNGQSWAELLVDLEKSVLAGK